MQYGHMAVHLLAAFHISCALESNASSQHFQDASTSALDALAQEVDSGPDAPSAEVRTYSFVSLTVRSEPGACVDCWRRFEVTNQGVLILEDAVGPERFMLSEAEYDGLASIANSVDFVHALRDRSCRHVPDADMSIDVTYSDHEQLSDPLITGCAGDPTSRAHPYAKLYWMLVALKKTYLECPLFESSVTWDTTKPPPERMLCYACGGQC
jgi:hypothetical protein